MGRTYGRVYFLPSEDEWYKAAYYKGGGTDAGYWLYATRQDSTPGQVEGGTAPGTAVYGHERTVVADPGQGEVHRPALIDNAGGLSAYGTMGQGGNVYEWNEALIGTRRGLRGGAFYEGASTLLASSRIYNSPNSTYYHPGVGFRVASIPEPGSAVLLLLAAMAGLLWRRR